MKEVKLYDPDFIKAKADNRLSQINTQFPVYKGMCQALQQNIR